MTNFNSKNRPGEFEIIAKLFAPLSRNAPGAFGLTDDAATIDPPPGHELVVTADMLTESVHFRSEDPPALVARKALRVNLSDLAAKGAEPRGYLLSIAVPRKLNLDWLDSFAHGLNEDQNEFSISLLGGDTTATDGPLTIAITAFGTLPAGTIIRRNGAKPGDVVFVTGTIGDAGAGLATLSDDSQSGLNRDTISLIQRYRIPQPRVEFGKALRGTASASLDVSDGLLADLAHIASTSGVKLVVDANRIPMSDSLTAIWGRSQETIVKAATAGDDYEIAFTALSSEHDAIMRFAETTCTPVTQIGRVEQGSGVVLLDSSGKDIAVTKRGYRHF